MEKQHLYCLLITLFLFFLFFYLLISMSCVEPLEYGLPYNRFTKTIGKSVYSSGRYILNPFKTFLIYPSNLITIEFSSSKKATSNPLQTRTGDGLSLTLSVSFQYKLIKEEIPKLYNLANINFHSTFVRISRDIILKVGGLFNATSYWTEREKIANIMLLEMNKELIKAYANCVSLQVLKIELPKSYEDSIVMTQVEIQKANMRKFEQIAELIRQNTSVIISEAEQKIKVVNASGLAEAYRIKAFANALALNKTVNAEKDVYFKVMEMLKMKQSDLIEYAFLDSVKGKKKSRILFDLQNTIVNFKGNDG